MSKKKACKTCKMFVEENECPTCKTTQFATNWKGRLTIIDASKSGIAKKVGVDKSAEYAIKVT